MSTLIDPVPEGWGRAPLGELCDDLATGLHTVVEETPAGRGVPVVRPGDILRRRIREPELTRLTTEEAAARAARLRLLPGDILISRTGTVGRCALVTPEQEGWLFSSFLVRLRPTRSVHAPYLVQYLTLNSVQAWIRRHATAVTIPSLSLETLHQLPVTLPPAAVQRDIAVALHALDEKARVHEDISRTTAEARNVMAEVLIRGEAPPPVP